MKELMSIKEKLQELAAETDEVKKSAFFENYLKTMAKFWKYSAYNQLLIFLRNPKATHVAGFQRWRKLGRYVKIGERVIRIFAPMIRLSKDGKEEIFSFRGVSVFDISQTDGKALPEIDIELSGSDLQPLMDKLLAFCETKKISVTFDELKDGLYGYSTGGQVVVACKDVNTQVNTLIHEIAHELLHHNGEKLSKERQEIQAEGTAYVVMSHFGAQAKSFNYLALYDADSKKIMENLDAIQKAAHTKL